MMFLIAPRLTARLCMRAPPSEQIARWIAQLWSKVQPLETIARWIVALFDEAKWCQTIVRCFAMMACISHLWHDMTLNWWLDARYSVWFIHYCGSRWIVQVAKPPRLENREREHPHYFDLKFPRNVCVTWFDGFSGYLFAIFPWFSLCEPGS